MASTAQTVPNTVELETSGSAASRALRERAVRHDNVHDIKRACAIVGWDLDFHQIQPGNLSARVAAGKTGDTRVIIYQVNLRIEVIGAPSGNHVTLISPDAGHTVWTNGFRLEDSNALLLPPHACLHLVGGPTALIQAQVPTRLLRQFGVSDPDLQSIDNRDGAMVVNLEPHAADSLRSLMSSVAFPESKLAGQEHRDFKLAALTGDLMRWAIEQGQRARIPRSDSWRTISRAREYIEANLHRTIRMGHISNYACASVSKIERIFQRELCMTPWHYILARRLHAVNRDLRTVNGGGVKIFDVAVQHGFQHHGRFSATYRSHFGELPSETLRAQIAPPAGHAIARTSKILDTPA